MKYHWIEQRLDQLGYTKKDLAQALSLPPSRVSEILKNKRQLKLSELPSLASTLQLSQSDLLSHLLQPTAPIKASPPLISANSNLAPNPLYDIWVIGRYGSTNAQRIFFWPRSRHYAIKLPLAPREHQDDAHFLAIEHRTSAGILDLLCIHSHPRSAPLPTASRDLQSPAFLQLKFSSPAPD